MSSTSALNSLLGSSTSSSSINLSTLLQAATGASTPGIDVSAAVAAAVYAAQAPERQWAAQQSAMKDQITALTGIQTALTQLGSDLNDLNNLRGSLTARTVNSSSSAVTGTATSSAVTGTHSVSVQNLATAAAWYSPAIANASNGLGTGTLTITSAGGQQTTFTTGSGTNSIAALATAINASSAGVQANVVNDANGSRLSLVGSSTGSTSDFTVSYGTSGASAWSSTSVASASTTLPASTFQVGDGTSTATITVNAGDTLSTVANSINAQGLGVTANVVSDSSGAHLAISAGSGSLSVSGDPAFQLTRAATGTNAALTVDGIPVSSATNTVSGAVAGLTLILQGITTGTNAASVAVAADTNSISNALSKFVQDYNSALSSVSSQFTYNASTGSQGALSGDTAMRSLQSTLLSIVSYSSPSGNSGSGSTVTSLSSLGITMNDDGSLSLNSAALNSALAKPADVQNFFQGASLNGFAKSVSTQLKLYSNAATGVITGKIKDLNSQYTALQGQIDDYESGYIASQKTVLTAMYSKAEIALQQLPSQLKSIQSQLSNNSGS